MMEVAVYIVLGLVLAIFAFMVGTTTLAHYEIVLPPEDETVPPEEES